MATRSWLNIGSQAIVEQRQVEPRQFSAVGRLQTASYFKGLQDASHLGCRIFKLFDCLAFGLLGSNRLRLLGRLSKRYCLQPLMDTVGGWKNEPSMTHVEADLSTLGWAAGVSRGGVGSAFCHKIIGIVSQRPENTSSEVQLAASIVFHHLVNWGEAAMTPSRT